MLLQAVLLFIEIFHLSLMWKSNLALLWFLDVLYTQESTIYISSKICVLSGKSKLLSSSYFLIIRNSEVPNLLFFSSLSSEYWPEGCRLKYPQNCNKSLKSNGTWMHELSLYNNCGCYNPPLCFKCFLDIRIKGY